MSLTPCIPRITHQKPSFHHRSSSNHIRHALITLFLSLLLITETVSQSTPSPTVETFPSPTHYPTAEQTCCECTEKAATNTTWCEYDQLCRKLICNSTASDYYSYCCGSAPDERCLLRATAICYELPTVPICCACTNSTHYAGCPKDIECQIEVCGSVDPGCCKQPPGWDVNCADSALEICKANTIKPTSQPTSNPTYFPTFLPTPQPTKKPTAQPTKAPTPEITLDPDLRNTTITPTKSPSVFPSVSPSLDPTISPTFMPTKAPVIIFVPTTYEPTVSPTVNPTFSPSSNPSLSPTNFPSLPPTNVPSFSPSVNPTNNPSLSPSVNPSLSPTDTPSSTPSVSPSINPSVSPSLFPTLSPTNNPSVTPTVAPSLNPSSSPSLSPSITPSSSPSEAPTPFGATAKPTADPTISPTRIPSESPTRLPTFYPSQTPTMFPSFEPSQTPTIFPTFYPSNAPTINATREPTSNPTNISIAPGCIECDKYLVELIDIKEHEEQVIETKECDYWEYKSRYSDSDSSNGFRRRRHRKKRHDRVRNKCTNYANGWSSSSRRRLSSGCNPNNGDAAAEGIRSKSWYHSIDSSDSDSDDDDDDDLYAICMTYAVKQYDYDECGLLDAVFLSLCDDNDTNWVNLTANDVDSIILSIYPDTLTANGAEIDGALGIMIHLNAQDIDSFELCLKNVSVTENYFANDFRGLDVSNWVQLNVDNEHKTCLNSDGLACLNYVFSRKCDEECECNDGLIEIEAKYIGDETAFKIIFYYDLDEIEACVFETVLKDEEIKCSLAHTKYEEFEIDTEFIIFYSNNTECKGVIDTNCNNEIAVKYCDELLTLIGWKDNDENICIIPQDIELNVADNGNGNALIDNDKMYHAFNIIAYEINSNWRTEIIIICSVLIGVICIAIYYLFYSTKLVYKYNKERPVHSAQVKLTQYDNHDDSYSTST